MPKGRGDRRTSKVKLERVLARIGKARFTSTELAAACKAERVKYDTVQRAVQRRGMVVAVGLVVVDGKLPQGAPERVYLVVGAVDVPEEKTA
jgi:hypothetical protein